MNKILNWTFGSLFRTIGRILGFLIVCILLLLIGSKLGLKIPDFLMPMKIKAAEQTIPYTDESYFRINTCDVRDTGSCSWVSGQTAFGSNKTIADGYTLNAFLARFYGSFTANTQYKFIINVSSSPGIKTIHSESSLIRTTTCNGLLDSELSQSVISGCRLNSVLFEEGSNTVQFIIYATPKTNQDFIQFNLYFNLPLTMVLDYFRVGTSTKITIETSVIDAITDSTNQIIDSQNQTNEKLDNIEDTLTDTSDIDISSLENVAGWLPPGPVDSILNLPLTMFNSLLSKLNSSVCTPVSLTLPFVNTTYQLPCINSLYDKIGITGTLFNTTGLIASAFILFHYLLALYKWIDDTLSLRENTMPGYFDDNWGGGM